MATQKISDLTPKCKTECLHVRIVKKWLMYKRPEIHFIFLDSQGDAIEAITDAQSSSYFDNSIRAGFCYSVTGYVCVEARSASMVVNRETSILFGRATAVIPIEDEGLPYYYFDFAPYSALQQRYDDGNKLLTDFIGRVVDITEVPNRSKNRLVRIVLQHESGKLIDVGLWEEIAIGFNQKAATTGDDPVIVAVTSLKVTTFLGALQLSSTSASQTYVNPAIPQLGSLIQKFKHMPTTDIPSSPTRNAFAERNIVPLSEAITKLADAKKATTCMVLAEIQEIHSDNGQNWYYESCIQCSNKVYLNGHLFYCLKHGLKDEHSYRYRFTGTLADANTTSPAVFFDGIVTSLVGKTCYDLVMQQTTQDPNTLPTELQQLEGKTFIFELQGRTDSYGPQLNVNKAYKPPTSTPASPIQTENEPSSSNVPPATPSAKTPKRKHPTEAEETPPQQKHKAKED